MRCLVLGLGNDLLGDDGVGLVVARRVSELGLPGVEVIESGEAGLALLELLQGFDRAIIVDAIQTGADPGTLHRLGRDDFDRVIAPSAHYAGLPEVFALGRELGIELPQEVHVLAIEVEDPYSFAETLTPGVEACLSKATEAVLDLLGQASMSTSTR